MYRKEYNIKKKYRDTNTTTTMNTLQLIMTQFAAIISLATASGILLHDSHIDKAFAGAVAAAQGIRAYKGGDLEVRALQDYFSA